MLQNRFRTTDISVIKRPFVLTAAAVFICLVPMIYFGHLKVLPVFLLLCVGGTVISFIFPAYAKHICIVIACMLTAFISFSCSDTNLNAALSAEGESRFISGTVRSYTKSNSENVYSFTLSDCKAENKAIPGKILVYAYSQPDVIPGDIISFTADELKASAKEGLFSLHSLSSGTYLCAYGAQGINIEGKDEADGIYYAILSAAKLTREKFFSNMPEDEAAVTTSLITGDKDYLDDETVSGLRQSGISHIFAVSGMHLTIWTGMFFIFFRKRSLSKFIPNTLAGIFVLFYIVFTGFSPSVLRAGIMLICVFAGRIFRRSAETLNSLGLAVTALLIYEPFLCGNISFLLSCLSTLTLILTSEKLSGSPGRQDQKGYLFRKVFVYITDSLKISVAVIISTLLPVTLFFGYISVFSPVSSLLMTPVAEGVMITGALAGLLPEGIFLGEILFGICGFFSRILINYVTFIRQFSFSIFPVTLSGIAICSAVAAAIYFFIPVFSKQKRTLTSFVLTFAGVILVFAGASAATVKEETEIFIPVATESFTVSLYKKGQFSAVYCPGKDYDAAVQNRIFLTSRGVTETDFLLLPDYTVKDYSNHRYLKRNLFPVNTYEADENKAENGFGFICALSDSTKIYSEFRKDFSAAVFITDEIKTVMLIKYDPAAPLPSFYNSADILICSESIPENINRENYSDIIILSKEKPDEKAVYSNHEKSLLITVKGESYAVY